MSIRDNRRSKPWGQSQSSRPQQAKYCPIAGMSILRNDGSNVVEWTEQAQLHLATTYGKAAKIFRDGVREERIFPSPQVIGQKYPDSKGYSKDMREKFLVSETAKYERELEELEDAHVKIWGTLLQVLEEAGRERVSTHSQFSAAKERWDVFVLWKIIIQTHSTGINSFNAEERADKAFEDYMKYKQGSGQDSQSLSNFMNNWIAKLENMRVAKCTYVPSEAESARRFLRKLDPQRYVDYMLKTINDARVDPDSWPKTFQSVVDGARGHIPSGRVIAAQRDASALAYGTQVQAAEYVFDGDCHRCHQHGHMARDCPKPPASGGRQNRNNAHAQPTTAPAAAGTNSQPAAAADALDKKKVKAKKDKGKKMYSARVVEDIFDNLFCAAITIDVRAVSAVRSRDHRCVTIDTMASNNFTAYEELLDEVKPAEFRIKGVNGTSRGTSMGQLPGFGDCYVAPGCDATGISFRVLEERYKIVYAQNSYYAAFLPDGFELRFDKDSDTGFYSCMFTDEVLDRLRRAQEALVAVSTASVADLEKQYSPREVKAARTAQQLARRLYEPSTGALIKFANGGALNLPITGKDVQLAETIYGRANRLKAATKFKGPVASQEVVLPPHQRRDQTAYTDVFFWREVPFVLFIAKPLMLLSTYSIKGKMDFLEMRKSFLSLASAMQARGFSARFVADRQSSIATLEGKIEHKVDVLGARSHNADAEREGSLLKVRLRAAELGVSWPVARRFIHWMVRDVTRISNFFPRLHAELAPKENFDSIKIDFKRDLRVSFGEYCEANIAPGGIAGNGPPERTASAISMCGTGNSKGTWWFFNIAKESFFTADSWTELPMTELIRAKMTAFYDADELKWRKKRCKLVSAIEARGGANPPERAPDIAEDLAIPPVARGPIIPEDDDDDFVAEPAEFPSEPTDIAADEIVEEINAEEHEFELDEGDKDYTFVEEAFDHVMPGLVNDDDDDDDNVEVQNPPSPDESGLFVDAEGSKRSARLLLKNKYRSRIYELKILNALKMSVVSALRKHESESRTAILAELKQLVDKGVWEVLSKSDLSKKQLIAVIRSSMFLKEKFDAAGRFQKLKARFVAGGNTQDKSVYETLSSPTVSLEALMMVIAIAAIEGRKIATVDITGAYLECELPEGDEVIMLIDPIMTKFLLEIDDSIKPLVDKNGCTYVRLKKALYGCVQSSLLWYNKLKSVLESGGFVRNDYDPCVFNKGSNHDQTTIAFHVDDLLITSKMQSGIDSAIELLQSNFEQVTANTGQEHSFLGMRIIVTANGIDVDMIAYLLKILEGKVSGSRVTYPADDGLLLVNENSPTLGGGASKVFHSDVAKLLFLAKRTRLEVLLAVSFLASRVTNPTVEDDSKLRRVFDYLATTKNVKLHFIRGGLVELKAYIDASYGNDTGGKSRTGVLLYMAGIGIAGWTAKQKLVTKSSTEAEIVALSDGLTHVLWAREFLLAQGHDVGAVAVYQDNQGVIKLMTTARNTKQRTKHLNVRYFFAADRVESKHIVLVYMPTDRMIADILTKALTGAVFVKIMLLLYGMPR